MDRDEALAAISASLRGIAPEADLAAVDPGADLAEELDLDSMDLLELRTAVHERTGVELPESGGAPSTLDGLITAIVEGP